MQRSFLLFVLTILSFSLFAQKKKFADIKNLFWADNDPYKNTLTIPEKWEDESAVIIYQEFNYQYKNNSRAVYYIESTRRRIKLLDKSAVDSYSEFSFAEKFMVKKGFKGKGGQAVAGVKVIKPNGKEYLLDMEDAVEVEGAGAKSFKKLAIPNLEVNDIIDYYYYIYEPFFTNQYTFEPIISTLESNYPIVKQKLVYEIGEDFYLNFKNLNGAPELIEEVSDDKNVRIYSLSDEHRPKSKRLRWFYPRREQSIIKSQVVFARNKKFERLVDAFIGEAGEVKNSVSPQEILEYYAKRLSFNKEDQKVVRYIKNKKLDESNDQTKLIEEVYYQMRFDHLIAKIEPLIFLNEGYVNVIPFQYGNFLSEQSFISKFGSFLKSREIDFDVIIAVPRSLSDLNNLMIKDEIVLMIRVNQKKPLYISYFSFHSNFDQIPYSVEGTEAYILNVGPDYRFNKIEQTVLPSSNYLDNQSTTTTTVTFEEDMTTLSLQRKIKHNGYNKEDSQNNLLNHFDYIYEDYDYFNARAFVERVDVKNKLREEIKIKLAAKQRADKKNQLEKFRKNAEQELDIPISSYKNFNINNSGRFGSGEEFSYHENYQLESLIKRAGNNYIVEVGKLIGGQVALSDEEMQRDQDVYMAYPRSFKNEISIIIPDGYTIQGLENLNRKVENASGGFEASASLEGRILKISSYKVYKTNFEKAENWPHLIAFLEEAYDFTQQKILLKQKSNKE